VRLDDEANAVLERLYKAHHGSVFRTALRFAAGDRQWAKDCMQDVFVVLAGQLPKLKDIDDIEGWLYRVTVNTALKRLRSAKRRGNFFERLGRITIGQRPTKPEETLQVRRDVHRLEVAIAELLPLQRAAMVLTLFEGKSQTEAAKLLGVSKGYMSKLHSRALAALQRLDWELEGE
jgi:RNA polymerase sigma-70 factor (ECF subfamily)